MHRVVPSAVVLAMALLAAPAAQAALNGDHGFAVAVDYVSQNGSPTNITLLSGSLDASPAASAAPMLFLNAGAQSITGLTKVCWAGPSPDCRSASDGKLQVSWTTGSSLGLKFPKPAGGQATANHALVLFANLGKTLSFGDASTRLDHVLVAETVGGSFAFTTLPSMPTTSIQDLSADNTAGIVLVDNQGTLTVTGSGAPATFRAAQDTVTFQGTPVIAPFAAEAMVLPFDAGSIHMGAASADAAAAGLDFSRLSAMQTRISDSFGSGSSDSFKAPDLSFLGGIQNHVLDGALISVPTSGESASVKQITLIRFDSLDASGSSSGVAASGQGPLTIQDGRVQNAPALIGFAFFQLPWWSYLLWVLAIGAFITRMVLGPAAPKKNERWDRFRWIGWVAGPLAFLLFFFLWDNEVHTVWGVSIMGGASGAGLGIVALLELAPLGIVFFAVVTPLRILLRSGFRIGKQGTFMGLAGPTATLVGFLFGATLMLSYVDLVLRSLP